MTDTVRLTHWARRCGCGAKLEAGRLEAVLAAFPDAGSEAGDPDLLVGPRTGDDAGVYRLADDLALVQTVDFLPPVVDDPYTFGQIAAANALSDVYAMGATPLTGLNLVAFPEEGLGAEVLDAILAGGRDKLAEAGAVLVGGHSVTDPEPKYGLAVTGRGHPDRLITNAGARPGDRLVLTKPLGTGIIAAGIQRDAVDLGLARRAGRSMAELNRAAAEAMRACGATAATDITGFGLAGHAREMARASGVDLELDRAAVPRLPGALGLLEQGIRPAGLAANRRAFTGAAGWPGGAPPEGESAPDADLLFDPQTSGGLLVALPEPEVPDFLERLGTEGAAAVGQVTTGPGGRVRIH